MAGSIQLFQSVRKCYRTLGIHPDPQSYLFNYRNLFAILCYSLSGISTLSFLLCKANTVPEYGFCIYAFTSQLCILYTLFIQMWQMPNILKLIASFEEFIGSSEYIHWDSTLNNIFLNCIFLTGEHTKAIYHILNVKVEKMCTLIYIVFVDGSLVGLLLPAVLKTFVNYLLGLNEKSFILPTPLM